jgi:Mg/Co/Ni transporter MgtE
MSPNLRASSACLACARLSLPPCSCIRHPQYEKPINPLLHATSSDSCDLTTVAVCTQDRVGMLSAMATEEAAAVLSCMTPDAAVALCRQLPSDRLEPLAALMSVHQVVMLLDQMDRSTVTAVLSSLDSAKANSVLRFMEGTVATELTRTYHSHQKIRARVFWGVGKSLCFRCMREVER